MMNSTSIIPGGIYRMNWEDSLRWVIAVDDVQVLYDTWSEADQTWRLRTADPPTLFYKSFHHNFRELSEYMGYDALTPEEIRRFGLDLPMCLCRHRDFQWPSNAFGSQGDFIDYCRQHQLILRDEIIMRTTSIVLIPYDSVLGMGDGAVIHARHEDGFTESDLLWQAHTVQQAAQHMIREGTGLHRQGWEQGYPSYYVGGYYDVAGYWKMQEELETPA